MVAPLVYISYLASALVAFCIHVTMPKEGRSPRNGVMVLSIAIAAGAVIWLFQSLMGSLSNRVVFCALALLGLGSAVRVVTHPRPVYSALYFILVVLSTAAMLIQTGAEFLGAALIIVYAGAILVTYVFVIMLSQQSPKDGPISSILDYDRSAREPVWASMACFALMATLAGMIVQRPWGPAKAGVEDAVSGRNTVELGRLLMTEYAVSVELSAVLLMVALVGAIAIARKRLPRADDASQDYVPGELGRSAKPF